MNILNKFFEKILQNFTSSFNHARSVVWYVKGIQLFAVFKIIMTWPVATITYAQHTKVVPQSWVGKMLLLPSQLPALSIHVFYLAVLVFLVFSISRKPTYITNLLFFWIALNLFYVQLLVSSGSDYVLLVLSFIAIPLAREPRFQNQYAVALQIVLFNLAVVVSQWQVALIYLISGWDKLSSEVWRSGDAFGYISHFDTMFNPLWNNFFMSSTANSIFSWATISFELAFAVLVWFRRTRLLILCAGIIFHVVIWSMLRLHDFALIMILSYIIFLKDSDHEYLKRWFKPQPL